MPARRRGPIRPPVRAPKRRLRREIPEGVDALAQAQERLRTVVSNAPVVLFAVDAAGTFTFIDGKGLEPIGMAPHEFLGRSIVDLEPDFPGLDRTVRRALAGEEFTEVVQVRDLSFEVWLSPVRDGAGRVSGAIGVANDVTERRAQTAALEYQALHDSLTDLPNRALLVDRLRQAIRVGRRTREPVALLLMDLDRFRDINDTLGHHKGDRVLQQIGPRIAAVLRASDTVARLGGDEFAFLLPGTDAEGAQRAAAKILHALERPVVVEDLDLDVGASIGVALFPEHGDDENLLIQRADVAMYVAKQARAGCALYEAAHDGHSPRRLALVAELRRAIENDQLVLHYQPTIDLRSGELVALEALVRWPHREHGLLGPDEFIPLAEHTGLIRPLTLRVLHAALGQCREWRRAGLVRRVAVNISARSLHDQRFPETIAHVLADHQLDPSALTIEITESAIMEDPERAFGLVSDISAMGTRLTIDDFGTGYSSLMHLKRLPVDEIKIDKSFVLNIHRDDSDAVISRSTIDLGHNLGMKVVAEGVETREALSVLVALGCDIAQGNLVAPPMPADEIPRWLRDTRWGKEKVIDLTRETGEPAPGPLHPPLRPRRRRR